MARLFRKARAFWQAFHKENRQATPAELAKALTNKQHTFEALFDMKRGLAKEAMPFTCIASLYDDRAAWIPRDEAYALRLIAAFAASWVSMEIKAAAKATAQLYDLDRPGNAIARRQGDGLPFGILALETGGARGDEEGQFSI